MATRLYVDFSAFQGQITPLLIVESGRKSNFYKHLCVSSIPVRMKKIESRMKALEWPQHFSNYKSMGVFETLNGSQLRSPGSGLAEIQIYRCSCYLQNTSDQKLRR